MPTTEILMNCFAGLGLLFVGIKMVTRSLGAVVGDQLRRWIEWTSARTSMAIVFGTAAGFVTQSGRTTSLIMASFVNAGLVDAPRALRVVLWSNLGCALVIFAAVFPLQLFALFLLAVAGVSIAFERPRPLLNVASATFGLALMLFGLKMTSSSASLLTDLDGVSLALAFIGKSLALAFLAGFVLTLIAQSHLSIMLIVVAMTNQGIFEPDQALMLIFGTHAGSSAITYVTGFHFRGVPKQIVVGQLLYNVAGIAIFLAFFAVLGGSSGLERLVSSSARLSAIPPGNQAAMATVLVNVVTPLVLTLALPAYHRLCARLSPPLADEHLARPLFLRSEVTESAATTLILAEREQLRLLRRLPQYCEWLREPDSIDPAAVERFHQAFAQVGNHIERTQARLIAQSMTSEDSEWLLNQQKRQQMLAVLNEAGHELFLAARNFGPAVAPLRVTLVEALDTLLLTAIAAVANRDAAELDVIDAMTRNHGESMERIRKKYLGIFEGVQADERAQILTVTSTFERAAWSLRNFAELLRRALDKLPVTGNVLQHTHDGRHAAARELPA